MSVAMIKLVDMRNPESLASRLRRRRFALFEQLLRQVPRPLTICDVGGTADFWRGFALDNDDAAITIVNVLKEPNLGGNVRAVVADARALPFETGAFDIVFSNSVIEHVGTIDEQRRMAEEVRRVGKRYFVQTPAYGFPIEPHFLVPGFHYLPIDVRAWLLTQRNLGWVPRKSDFADAKREVESVRLLRLGEFRRMFPDSTIYKERFLGLTKSFIAYGGW